jgi:hypothetical protein
VSITNIDFVTNIALPVAGFFELGF